MKKIMAVAICCTMLLSLLSGCGSKNGQTGSQNKQTESTNASEPGGNTDASKTGGAAEAEGTVGDADAGGRKTEYEKSEYKNIDWFLSASPIPSPWNLDMPVLAEISKKTGAVMQANIPAQDADTKLNLLMVNGQLPDVISITNQTLYAELITAGQVWNIQEFFETYLPDAKIINGGFPEDIKNAIVTRDGDWYAIPSHIISKDNAKIWPLTGATEEYWNGMDVAHQHTWVVSRPILREYGISEESLLTEEGLLDAIRKIKELNVKNKDGAAVYPFMVHGSDFWQWTTQSINNLFGAMPVDKDGNYQSEYYSDQYKDGIEFLNQCYREGLLDPSIMTMDEATIVAMMNDDRVFCYMGGTAANAMAERKIKDADGNLTNEYVYFCPGVIDWESGYQPAIGINSAVGTGWIQTFINKDCKEPEAVARFIDYMMMEEEGLTLWNYGIEGEHWIRNDRGLIERTPEGQKAYDNMATTGVGAFWLFCNQNYDRKVTNITNDIDEVVSAVVGRSPKTYIYDTAAFQMPSGYIEAGSKYDITSVEINNYLPQQLSKLIMAESVEEFETLWQEFITTLDKLGLRELNEYKNEIVQKNFESFGYTLKAVN